MSHDHPHEEPPSGVLDPLTICPTCRHRVTNRARALCCGFCRADPREYFCGRSCIEHHMAQEHKAARDAIEERERASRSPHTMGFSEGEPIDLRTLQRMNLARVEAFGMAIEDWTPMAWGSELAEEVGEFQREVLLLGSVLGKVLGAVKKRSRTPHPTEPGKDISGKAVPSLDAVAAELADVVIVANLLASRLGVDLNNAIRAKWNRTSEKVNWPARL